MAVNMEQDDAVLRVGTLNIRADRVQTEIRQGQGESSSETNTLNWTTPTYRTRRLGVERNLRGARPRDTTDRSAVSRVKSRCFFSLMTVPFAISFALLALGIATFVVKNEQVNDHCNTSCSLVCGDHTVFYTKEACTVAYACGGLTGGLTLLIVLGLLVRVCLGSKILNCWVVSELFILMLSLAGAILLALLFAIDNKTKTCLKSSSSCNNSFDFEDWNDFMQQAQYTVWVGAGVLATMTIVWLFLSVSTCCVAYGRREQRREMVMNPPGAVRAGGRRPSIRRFQEDETQPLLN